MAMFLASGDRTRCGRGGFGADRRGVAVVEFALVAPVLALLLFGILGYGQYFLIAHSAQQIANDAARASVAGVDASDRKAIVAASVSRSLAALPEIRPQTVTSSIGETPSLVTVRVMIDARAVPLLRSRLLPLPSAVIERRAVARPGGIA